MLLEDKREWNLYFVLELEGYRRNRMYIVIGGILIGFKE